ncbi:hypothetical protein [Dialister micraerophilus]|nr:hypothetical protein [Dialister micraerophilus]
MAVTETRVRISLIDNMTSGLNRVATANDRFTNSLRKASQTSQKLTRNIRNVNTENMSHGFDSAVKSADRMNRTLNHLIFTTGRYLAIYKGFSVLGGLFEQSIGGAFKYAKDMETNRVGISGILTSMTDLGGKTLTWNKAMGISKNILADLQQEALKTAATSEEMIETFRALLAPSLASGMTIDQVKTLTSVGVNAVKSLGLPSNQIVQELRDLVQGGIRPASSTLATSLGLTDADIKRAKQSSEGLFNFLMKRLEGFKRASLATQDTVEGKEAQIMEGIQRGLALGGDKLYKFYGETLKEFADYVVTIDKATGEWKINSNFSSTVSSLTDDFINISTSIKTIVKDVAPIAKGVVFKPLGGMLSLISRNLTSIILGFTAIKGLKLGTDIIGGAFLKDEQYTPQTRLGEMIRGLRYRLTGERQQLEELTTQQEAFNNELDRFRNSINAFSNFNNFLKSNSNSIYNLSRGWEQLGLNAETAKKIEQEALTALAQGNKTLYEDIVRKGDLLATTAQKEKERSDFIQRAYEKEIASIKELIALEKTREHNADTLYKRLVDNINLSAKSKGINVHRNNEERINGYIKNTDNEEWKRQIVSDLNTKLKETSLSVEQIDGLTLNFLNTLKDCKEQTAFLNFENTVNSAKLLENQLLSVYGVTEKITQAELRVKEFLVGTAPFEGAKADVRTMLNTMERLGVETEKAYEFTSLYVNAINTINPSKMNVINDVYKNIINSAERYIEVKRQEQAENQKEIEINQRLALEVTALHNAYKVGGEKSYQAVQQIITREKELTKALEDRGLATDELNSKLEEYLQLMASATKEEQAAIQTNTEIMLQNEEATLGLANKQGKLADKANKVASSIGTASLALGILTSVIGDSAGEYKDIVTTIGDWATKIGLVTMGIESLLPLLPVIKSCIVGITAVLSGPVGLIACLATAVGYLFTLTDKFKELTSSKYRTKVGKDSILFDIPFTRGWAEAHSESKDEAENQRSYHNTLKRDANGKLVYSFSDDDLTEGLNFYGNSSHSFFDDEMKAFNGNNYKIDSNGKFSPSSNDLNSYVKSIQDQNLTLKDLANKIGNEDLTSHVAKQEKERLYKVEVPIGQEIANYANTFEDGMQWVGSFTDQLDVQCASFVSELYKANGVLGLWTDRVDVLADQFGSAYHRVSSNAEIEERAEVGDMIRWNGHTGIYMGNGMYRARNSSGGVHTGTLEEGERWFGTPEGYGSISEYTSGRTVTEQVNEERRKAIETQRETERSYERIQNIMYELNKATRKANGTLTEYDETMETTARKILSYHKDIIKAKHLGIDVEPLKKAIDDYAQAMQKMASLKRKEKNEDDKNAEYQAEIEHLKRLHDLGELSLKETREQVKAKLKIQRDYLAKLLKEETMTAKRRAEIEKRLTDVTKEIRADTQETFSEALDKVGERLTNKKLDFQGAIDGVVQDTIRAGEQLVLASGSFSEKINNFFDTITNSIMSKTTNLIMNGLIDSLFMALHIPTHASGGTAREGLAIVGEQGPELVHFGKTSQVYTNRDTQKLLGGNGTNVNIKVNLKNESGVQMQSEQQGEVQFDGESYVLSIVLKGISENKLGIRSALKGMTQNG